MTMYLSLSLSLSLSRMGQVQSEVAMAGEDRQAHSAASNSIDSLITEAAAYGNDGNEDQSLDAKDQKALECPCIADLRKGPCGLQFSEAFACYLKSTVEEKGSDCVHPFIILQNCIKDHPGAFSGDIVDEDESKKEETLTKEHKIIPPAWSKEQPQSPKSKL